MMRLLGSLLGAVACFLMKWKYWFFWASIRFRILTFSEFWEQLDIISIFLIFIDFRIVFSVIAGRIIKEINIEFDYRIDFPACIRVNLSICSFLNIHKTYLFNTATIYQIIAERSILWRQFVKVNNVKSFMFRLVSFNTWCRGLDLLNRLSLINMSTMWQFVLWS